MIYRILNVIILTILAMGCVQKTDQPKENSITSETKNNLVSEKGKFDFYNDSILTHIDAEELCEFSFDFFLPQLNQKLAKKDVQLNVQTKDDYEDSSEIVINERSVQLYTKEELANGAFWESGPRNFFRVVNEILREKNIDEQFYLLYGGNDLHAILLTEQQFEIMSKLNKENKNEIPYLP